MEQRTKKWHEARIGKFTGSEIHKLMGKSLTTQTAQTYIYEKVAEQLTGEVKQTGSSQAMEWGTEHEDEAKKYYELAFNSKIVNFGFEIPEWCPECGVSPDGLIYQQKYGIEIKCPFNSANHVVNLGLRTQADLKDEHPEYYWQVMMCIAVFGYDGWEFVSYDPRMPDDLCMIAMMVKADESDILLLKGKIFEAVKIKQSIIDNIIRL